MQLEKSVIHSWSLPIIQRSENLWFVIIRQKRFWMSQNPRTLPSNLSQYSSHLLLFMNVAFLRHVTENTLKILSSWLAGNVSHCDRLNNSLASIFGSNSVIKLQACYGLIRHIERTQLSQICVDASVHSIASPNLGKHCSLSSNLKCDLSRSAHSSYFRWPLDMLINLPYYICIYGSGIHLVLIILIHSSRECLYPIERNEIRNKVHPFIQLFWLSQNRILFDSTLDCFLKAFQSALQSFSI